MGGSSRVVFRRGAGLEVAVSEKDGMEASNVREKSLRGCCSQQGM